MLRFPVEPMKATLGTMPSDESQWAFEIKWDGYRTLAFVDDGALRLQSSNKLDVTVKYPELASLPHSVNASGAVLDGELVVLDDEGRPSFELMQRHQVGDREVAFFAFDVLRIGEHDTIGLPYEQRRELLASVLEPGANWSVPPNRLGDGSALLEFTAERGMEGVMAKRLGSLYVPGKRSPNWRKVKNRVRTEVVIGGFTAGTGNRSSTFGSLLVGVEEADGGLRFAGGVGTGFSQHLLDQLRARFDALATELCPFAPPPPREYVRDATWIRPSLRALVEIAEWTNEGYVRHASFISLLE